MTPLDVPQRGCSQLALPDLNTLWLRGGFPDSFTAGSDGASMRWRGNFIRTYLERDLPQSGLRAPAETLRRFWTMLCHRHGSLFNAAELARSLGISVPSVIRYADTLVDLMLVRRLQPYFTDVGKRLIKTPKLFVRDSGIVEEPWAVEIKRTRSPRVSKGFRIAIADVMAARSFIVYPGTET